MTSSTTKAETLSADPVARRVRVDDLDFRMTHTTAGSDGTYLLIHGVGMSRRSHARLHRRLAVSAAVCSLDLPGFAGLPVPRGDVSVERMADAIARLAGEHLKGPLTVVGHSMGAQWAVELAVRHPAAVAGVVLIGPVVDDRHRTLRAQGSALARDGLREPPRVNARVILDYLRSGKRWFFSQARNMRDYRIHERIVLVAAPTLLIRGAADPIAGEDWLVRLHRRAPQGRIVTIAGGGHHVQWTAADAVARTIVDFCRETRRR